MHLRPLALLVCLAACGDSDPASDPADLARVAGPSLTSPQVAEPEDPAEPVAAEEPEVEPGEARTITYADLSLVGADVTGLLDLVFSPDAADHDWEFPEHIQALDGLRVEIVGYMIALDYEGEDVTRFMLVRDLAACCFGGIPRPDEWVDVTLAEPCPYFIYRPVRATGVLSVGLDRYEDGLVASAFQLTGATARAER